MSNTIACTPNQIEANCFTHDMRCVYTCSNVSDPGCFVSGMYGSIKLCPTLPLPRPKVNESYSTYVVPDDPSKIASLSYGGLGASRDAGLLYAMAKTSISSSVKSGKIWIVGSVVLIFILLFIMYKLKAF